MSIFRAQLHVKLVMLPRLLLAKTRKQFSISTSAEILLTADNEYRVFYAKCLLGRTFKDNDQVAKVLHPDLPSTVILEHENPLFELDFQGRKARFVSPTKSTDRVSSS